MRPACPACAQDTLRRMPRHLRDRLWNLLRRRVHYRWRCQADGCGWQGCLPGRGGLYSIDGGRSQLLDVARLRR